jgi:non-specific serine/threonine protein kinase
VRCVAELLRHPRREVHVLELDMAVSGVGAESPNLIDASGVKQLGLRVNSGHGDEPLLDARARAEYRQRLEALREQLETAQEMHNGERAATIQTEIDALAEELAVGMGLGGRARKRSSAAELVRQNISRAIKSAITRIRADNPQLALYLNATIKKGAFCSYNPDTRLPVRWRL